MPANGFANRCIAPPKKPDKYSFCSGVKLSEPTGEMDAMPDALCSEDETCSTRESKLAHKCVRR